ncbi:hybrid sensor histidine kinase/response regulator [Arcobacteraceae bacterium]|nr:hybrid sensor histidine kinase/response regulator [Arcobacteraceae bacterium]
MLIDILIVDDVKSNLISLEALLESMDTDFNIIKANNGMEALDFALSIKPHLIILDIQMPDIDGFEVAQLLKVNKYTQDIPIIFLTAAFKSEEFVEQGFSLGAIDYLTKPIDEHQFSNRISLYSKLIKSMEENRQKDLKLNEQSKLVSMGEMIGNIAHQWRQPLSVISTGITGMQLEKEYGLLTDEKFNKTCDVINSNAQYLSKTIDDFRNFVKGERIKKLFNLKNDIESFLHLVEGSIKNENINVILTLDENITIDGYENELTQCFINIFNNAKDALANQEDTNRLVFISTEQLNKQIIIKIKDNGGGILPEALTRVFEPYYTTKHQSQGTGLGLHMTYNLIVDGMGGTLDVYNREFEYDGYKQKGAEFIIKFPLY